MAGAGGDQQMGPASPLPTALESAKMPPAMRAAIEQLDAIAVAELVAHKELKIAMHRDAAAMLRFGAKALATVSSEVVHHALNEKTGQLLELLAQAACALRDAYRERLAEASAPQGPQGRPPAAPGGANKGADAPARQDGRKAA